MQSRAVRAGRGTAAALFATLAASVSHTLAGGEAPSLFSLLVTFVIATMVCTLLAGRTISLTRLAIGIGLSQALFHGVFVSLGIPTPVGHEHTVLVLGDSPGTMWAAHAAAAVLTVIVTRYAETAFFSLGGVARLLLRRLVGCIIPVDLPARVAVVALERTPTVFDIVLAATRHRGPPAVISA